MNIIFRVAITSLLILSEIALSTENNIDARMLRYPDVSGSHIVFVYAEDIWIVDKKGGIARKLTSPKGQEMFPKFSPDGYHIAFSGNYDGNIDIYTMPSTGGEVKRLTYHPDDDYMVEWYPDSENILYKSEMLSFVRRFNRFFKINLSGGLSDTIPLPFGEHASFGTDVNTLFFQYTTMEDRNWKRYMGGMTSDIWKYDFVNDRATKITSYKGSDSLPMWSGKYLYYLSDSGQNHKNNIWKLDLGTGTNTQITYFDVYDVKWPSYGNGSIVLENGGKLFMIDTQTNNLAEVKIIVQDDLPDIRPEHKDLSKYITNYEISPDGEKVLFEARGEVFIYDVGNGFVKNVTNSSGSAERYPSWSHDSKKIAYFSDESGEYDLVLADLKEDKKDIIKLQNGYYYNIQWSPDNKKIAFSNNTGFLYFADTATHDVVQIDKDNWVVIDNYSWSPDSKWVAYSKRTENFQSSVFLYDLKNNKSHQITNDFYNDNIPVFSDDGEYLAFYSDRYFKPVYSDMDDTWIYPNSTELYIITLNKQKESPFLPNYKPEKKKNEDEKATSNRFSKKIKIDFENIENRVIKIPISAGNFSNLEFIGNRMFYIRRKNSGDLDTKSKGYLKYYDLNDKKEKNLVDNINDFDLSADGKKYLYKSGDRYGVSTTDKEVKAGKEPLNSKKISGLIDYKKEWNQIFNEAWRIERDFFYDPNMHGNDWLDIRKRYEKLLKHVVSRRDLNYVIGEMVAELNSSHTYVRNGDFNEPVTLGVGLLGCDFGYDKENDAFYFKKIYGDTNSQNYVRSPLLNPGVNIKEGDYLLMVNGSRLKTSLSPLVAFQGLEEDLVELTVNESPDLRNSLTVLIKTITRKDDLQLRYFDWIENNRRKVDEFSNGRIGYIYVPDTSARGQNELIRQFIPQKYKQALIIDERFNSGGQIPDRFIELLNRPIFNYWARRDQRHFKTPLVSHTGPKVMIINGWSGSGGDAFPYYFKKAALGPIVGLRTLGGLIGIGGYPILVDGGYVTAPAYAFFDTHGNWGIEGYGVDPDYEVENISNERPGSSDPQLDKAIKVLIDKLDKLNNKDIKIPDYPDRSGKSQ